MLHPSVFWWVHISANDVLLKSSLAKLIMKGMIFIGCLPRGGPTTDMKFLRHQISLLLETGSFGILGWWHGGNGWSEHVSSSQTCLFPCWFWPDTRAIKPLEKWLSKKHLPMLRSWSCWMQNRRLWEVCHLNFDEWTSQYSHVWSKGDTFSRSHDFGYPLIQIFRGARGWL